MSNKTKNILDKINKVLLILLGISMIACAGRITHYYITEYVDNSVNEYSVVKVETSENNKEKN